MKNNFFLYAVHFAWVRLFNKLSARILPPCPASALVMFGLMPFFMVVISSWLGKFLRIVAPGIDRRRAGGRGVAVLPSVKISKNDFEKVKNPRCV